MVGCGFDSRRPSTKRLINGGVVVETDVMPAFASDNDFSSSVRWWNMVLPTSPLIITTKMVDFS